MDEYTTLFAARYHLKAKKDHHIPESGQHEETTTLFKYRYVTPAHHTRVHEVCHDEISTLTKYRYDIIH